MMLPQRSNLASFKSIIANAIKIISNISFGNDAGTGIDILPLHMIKKLTIMSAQKAVILKRKTIITSKTRMGIAQIMANGANPACMNW